jgi:hypothetical protein
LAPAWSSSARNARPIAGRTPSTSKKFHETRAAESCSGSPWPVRLKFSLVKAANPENAWLFSLRNVERGNENGWIAPAASAFTA